MTIPSGYRSHADVVARLRAIGARALGTTIETEPVLACELGPADARRATIVIAGIHAMEWIGVETALALLERLAVRPPTDRRIIVVPVANPDGYLAVERDLRDGRRYFRRGNARNVDLNRNWPTGFRRSARRLPPMWTWHGGGPCSEPEVAAIVGALDAEVAAGRTVDVALSLHSFGRKLLVPWGSRWKKPTRDRELRTLAAVMQARLAERYTIDQVSRWLPGAFVRGMELDHLHAQYGARAILVECSGGGLSLDPRSWIEPFRWYNPSGPAAIAADLARAVEPFVRG
ncbi:MAG: succinylglutamate desuccinylase/aspartoacylase family protein [Deltaproteobacteria bacterium]|nr:succinylglutamate desuccinylase/aspartoacylase family protein [Deltaproteobacteria bacterium]